MTHGYPLAVMDSIEITILRTAAATAVAARRLARADADTVTIAGCGNQGRAQLRALGRVRRLRAVYAYDSDPARAGRYAAEMGAELSLPIQAVRDLAAAVPLSDICVTCTPARRFLLRQEDVRAGTFIAAVGADAPDKQELDPQLFAGSKVVVDNLDQCAEFGDLHHAIEAGLTTRAQVHADLAQLVAGQRPGRVAEEEITIFDSTGVALEDVAAAVAVYRRALERGAGTPIGIIE
jgi:ornithine cyclodeaminase/alanine dehydrogenase-like protein (mu-crystallin family)